MAFSRLVFTVLFLSLSCHAIENNELVLEENLPVPVYMWGDLQKPNLKSNPLMSTTAPEFSEILQGEIAKGTFTVVFVDESLSVEDFSRNTPEENTFSYLHENIGKSLYLPSVDGPVRALLEIADPDQIQHVKLTEQGLSNEIEYDDTVKALVVDFKDAEDGESRMTLLRRHDEFMNDMFVKLQNKHDKVIGVYTARFPSWVIPESSSRVRRQADPNVTADSDYYVLEGLHLYYKALNVKDFNETKPLAGEPVSHTELNSTDFVTVMNTTLTFGDSSLILNFIEKSGYWFFDSLIVYPGSGNEKTLFPTAEVYALMDASYRCGQTIVFNSVNGSTSVIFEDMQIQPYFTNTTNTTISFGEPFHCVGFFSIGIWASLMVTFILLSITFYGLMMMMDIKTMDRFDDPKGKTITINTAE